MNTNKFFGPLLVVMLLAFSGAAYANTAIKGRITALKTSINEAYGDSQINKNERDSLLIEWNKLNKLYTTYVKDKKLSQSETATLDSKIKNFDLNLFRKKYD
ncbi:hypothetical protein [Leucothrix pacifica]|uniref:Uncharacterized protein n=1 Tax=Leucothrix pacifica TaxID=1247513 RepID=A0A317CMJ9_9GAMM|nr:hypothetical protein [Leucothrix pacifica]PWQ99768.1 hypothetical protein DKW60_04650 [Leucothrix pacifica]